MKLIILSFLVLPNFSSLSPDRITKAETVYNTAIKELDFALKKVAPSKVWKIYVPKLRTATDAIREKLASPPDPTEVAEILNSIETLYPKPAKNLKEALAKVRFATAMIEGSIVCAKQLEMTDQSNLERAYGFLGIAYGLLGIVNLDSKGQQNTTLEAVRVVLQYAKIIENAKMIIHWLGAVRSALSPKDKTRLSEAGQNIDEAIRLLPIPEPEKQMKAEEHLNASIDQLGDALKKVAPFKIGSLYMPKLRTQTDTIRDELAALVRPILIEDIVKRNTIAKIEKRIRDLYPEPKKILNDALENVDWVELKIDFIESSNEGREILKSESTNLDRAYGLLKVVCGLLGIIDLEGGRKHENTFTSVKILMRMDKDIVVVNLIRENLDLIYTELSRQSSDKAKLDEAMKSLAEVKALFVIAETSDFYRISAEGRKDLNSDKTDLEKAYAYLKIAYGLLGFVDLETKHKYEKTLRTLKGHMQFEMRVSEANEIRGQLVSVYSELAESSKDKTKLEEAKKSLDKAQTLCDSA